MTDSDNGAKAPTRYVIEALLNSGVQPFQDLDRGAMKALTDQLDPKVMAVPVVLTGDGVLVDGHQRLRALLGQGRKYISAQDVRVLSKVDAAHALEWAVRLNVQRRHLTVEEKAAAARQLQAERGWSQAKVAELFGVSRPAVSQWLAATDTEATAEQAPAVVTGTDGVDRTVTQRRAPQIKRAAHPLSEQGELFRMTRKLTARLEPLWTGDPNVTQGLDPEERDAAVAALQDLAVRVEAALEALGHDQPSIPPLVG